MTRLSQIAIKRSLVFKFCIKHRKSIEWPFPLPRLRRSLDKTFLRVVFLIKPKFLLSLSTYVDFIILKHLWRQRTRLSSSYMLESMHISSSSTDCESAVKAEAAIVKLLRECSQGCDSQTCLVKTVSFYRWEVTPFRIKRVDFCLFGIAWSH